MNTKLSLLVVLIAFAFVSSNVSATRTVQDLALKGQQALAQLAQPPTNSPSNSAEGEGEEEGGWWNEYANSEWANAYSSANFNNVNWNGFSDEEESETTQDQAGWAQFDWKQLNGWNATGPGHWWTPALADDTPYWNSIGVNTPGTPPDL